MKFKFINFIFILFILFTIINNINIVNAKGATVSSLLDRTGNKALYNTNEEYTSYPKLVGRIIKIVLSLLGVICVCLMIYAGFLWMTASGKSEQVEKAQDTLKNAIIGLIIIISAYAITYFVLYSIAKDYTNTGFN